MLYVFRKPYGIKLFLNNNKSNTYFKFKECHHFGYIERIKKKGNWLFITRLVNLHEMVGGI